ncbi:hypothetical protein CEK25_011524 [Fusarium fujikuroi]|nr:hypothetical protein CEK25_011524 [Fusarium fujikuroi]
MSTSISFLTDCTVNCRGKRDECPRRWIYGTTSPQVSTCPRTSAPLPISGENAHLKKAGFYFGPERHVAEPPKPCEDTLLDAFDALNSASINQEQDLPPLDQSLRDAMQRLRGTNIDEVGILEKHQWMTTRRMQCLKGLDRESESKAQILELKNIASRREDLWTSQDRQKEKYQNLTAMMERRMGGLSSSTRVKVGDYVFRPRTFHRVELETNLQAEQSGGVAQQVGDIDTRLTSTTMVGASTGSPSRHRAEEEDLENLYLINKPWMRKVDELLNALGGIRVEEYYDFEIPPSRIGGLFLYRSRVFMANGFLEMLGVAK